MDSRRNGEKSGTLDAIVQSAADAIVTADDAGLITTFNPAAQRMFGHREAEIIGTSLATLVPERFRSAHDAGLARVVSTGETRIIGKTVEVFGLHRDGHEFPIELSLGNWKSKGRTYFSAIINDISGRKEAERLLIEAKEEAERANHSMALSLSNMGAKLRSPLSSIVDLANMLSSGGGVPLTHPKQKECAKEIEASSKQLLQLIDEFLESSKDNGAGDGGG